VSRTRHTASRVGENAEIVFESYRRFEAEDFDGLEQLWAPEGRITSPEGWPETGPFEDRDAVMGQFRRLAAGMGDHRFREMKVVAESAEWVVIDFIWEVRGAVSGVPVATKLAMAARIEDGRYREAHYCWSVEEALEAAGLSAA
jgi:ketosteroid isomerase-like protein